MSTPSMPLQATAAAAAAATLAAPSAGPSVNLDQLTASLNGWRWRGLAAVGLWVALFVGWSVVAPISGAVVGGGLVKVEANRLTVSHRDGGIVAKVLVKEGEVVAKGQPLLMLEDVRVDSTVDLLRAQLVSEKMRQSRLEAEAAQKPSWTPPQLTPDKQSAGSAPLRATEAVLRERSAFEARRRSLEGQIASVNGQISDTAREVSAHQRNNVASAEAIRLMREEIVSNEQLLQENFVNRTRVMGLKRNLAEYESKVEATEAELSKARQRQAELQGRLASLRLAYVQQATEELREATARIVDFEERLRASRDAADRQVVVAPAAGRLVDLKVNTVGSTIGPREPLVDIVPSEAPLVVETQVAADAVGEVQAGQPAEVRILGTKQRSQDMLLGTVRRISADALVDPRSGAPFFQVQVEISPQQPGGASIALLKPGLSAEVYIRTSERTALGFLMEPMVSGLRKSFREH